MKALVVEDELKIANAIARGLRQERFAVDVCEDGEEGLNNALVDEYDVIVLDRMLPNVDGIEVCRKIREATIKTPVIMLTAKAQIKDRVEGLDAGADDYLVKPFSFEELLARVRALLRRPQDCADVVLKVADLTLDPANFKVHRRKMPIKLSNTEFALLEFLMRNEGQIQSKDKIISHVWDFDADILPNTVEAHIGSLRRKIDAESGGKPLIHTVRGFGYRVDDEK